MDEVEKLIAAAEKRAAWLEDKFDEGVGIEIRRLVAVVRKAKDGLDVAIYDLERIRDAAWHPEQMRMGARSGAHVANQAAADCETLAKGEG